MGPVEGLKQDWSVVYGQKTNTHLIKINAGQWYKIYKIGKMSSQISFLSNLSPGLKICKILHPESKV